MDVTGDGEWRARWYVHNWRRLAVAETALADELPLQTSRKGLGGGCA
jgi:hypothetical protein